MNYAKKNLIYFVIHTSIGIIALLVALSVKLPDGYRDGVIWGIAGGFITTGILGIITSIRLMKNPKKVKEVEIAKNEERTQLIRMKTNSAVYTVLIYTECIGTLITGLLGLKLVTITLAAVLVFQVVLFTGFATYYSRKY